MASTATTAKSRNRSIDQRQAMKTIAIIATSLLLALASFALGADAKSPAKEKAKEKEKPAAKAEEMNLPLTGKVVSITKRTLTLAGAEGKEDRKYAINKDTVIENGAKPATTDDIKPGQQVTGSYLRTSEGDTLKKLQISPANKKASPPKKK